MPKPSDPRACRDPNCDIRIIFAQRAGTTRWGAYEATDQPPFSQAAIGCFVIVADQAWKPSELIEDFQTRGDGMSQTRARELVSGLPFHRPHHHEPADQKSTPGTNTDKEHQPA